MIIRFPSLPPGRVVDSRDLYDDMWGEVMRITSVVRACAMTTSLAAFGIVGAGPAGADTPPPTILSISYESYQLTPTFKADTLEPDWGQVAPANRIFGTAGGSEASNDLLFTPIVSPFRDTGTPRSHLSYRLGACATFCASPGGTNTVSWGPWFHPSIPTSVNAAGPAVVATSGTKASPGIKVTINPGAHAGANSFLIYSNGVPLARIPATQLTYTDTAPARPKDSYQVAACYADCDRPTYGFGDGYKPVSALGAAASAWVADTSTCKVVGQLLYNAKLSWQGACKP